MLYLQAGLFASALNDSRSLPNVRLLFVIALNEKFYFKVGEIELDESYFGARRVRGNDIKSSRIKREGAWRAWENSLSRLMRECLIIIWNAKARR